MISIDTNILFYGIHSGLPQHKAAKTFLKSMEDCSNVIIAELVLVELYQLLRNPKVMSRELSGAEAVDVIDTFRSHPLWRIAENAPVMEYIWPIARKPDFARRKMFDLRLGYTLLHHGVTQFATANISDFKTVGFERLWNPLK